MIRVVSILFAVLIFGSCSRPPQKNLEGIWIGGHYEADKETNVPYPYLLEFKADSTFYINSLVDTFQKEASWSITQDSLVLNNKKFPLSDLKVNDETYSIASEFSSEYFRVRKAKSQFNKEEIESTLTQGFWESDKVVMHFKPDGKYVIYDKASQESVERCWALEDYKDIVLLIKKGDKFSCNRNIQFTEQIIMSDGKSFSTYGSDGAKYIKTEYKHSNQNPAYPEAAFQLCNPYLNLNFPWDRFYYNGTDYKGGLYSIRKEFAKSYTPVKEGVNNGLVRVRFVVSCSGKTGMFEVLQLDKDYKPIDLNPQISEQLLAISKSLNGWIPGQRDNTAIDTFKFLSFKIKDGKIEEIFF